MDDLIARSDKRGVQRLRRLDANAWLSALPSSTGQRYDFGPSSIARQFAVSSPQSLVLFASKLWMSLVTTFCAARRLGTWSRDTIEFEIWCTLADVGLLTPEIQPWSGH